MNELFNKLGQLGTEKRNQDSKNIDLLETKDVLTLINNEDKKVASIIESKLDEITGLTDLFVETIKNGGNVYYAGCGTSGRMAMVDAAEVSVTYGTSPSQLVAMMGGGLPAMKTPVEGLEDRPEEAEKDCIANGITNKDLIIGIAASGRTPYPIGAIMYGKKIGCKTGAISCVENAEMSALVDKAVEIPTGAEVVLGSTRMKAGLATKIVLNMMSSAAMIRLGHTFSNYLIDGVETTEKGHHRVIRQMMEITGCSQEVAETTYKKSNRSFKLATLMVFANVNAQEGKKLLSEHENSLKKTLIALNIKYKED